MRHSKEQGTVGAERCEEVESGDTKVYKRLAAHLDRLPGGYPATESGVELRILKKLFTPEEAELACHLTLLDENARVVAYRAGISVDRARIMLEQMAKKGLIFFEHPQDGEPIYMAAQFVVGIWEMQVGFLNPELVHLFEEYLPTLFHKEEWRTIPQLRTIPVEKSIGHELKVLPYEMARELIRSKTDFVVTPCICRLERAQVGEGCHKPLETCISFGTENDYFISNGFGRKATLEEVLAILDLADKKGLVIQPNNGKEVKWLCCCCGCCCGVLRTIKTFPKPRELTSSPFILTVNTGLCDGCKRCIKRCQMEALTMVNGRVELNEDRCIGCGLCVTSCSTNALNLKRKARSEQPSVPQNIVDASIKTLKLRHKARLPDLALMVLRAWRDRFLSRNYR